ncbi:hypothetical protein P170DRAFT_469473 [Aspergillus steynii IBT 23096]|uniref:MYND-type domain-containing protein n=1 Tax=Aspergillus steynii IBT 23096 TaxID=1392250 RepID=A0A2I2GMC0_9EURO|nr:uncharacterized protein P170DRAFT_469473 [Aspergillus steynii IBT 23096]PLB53999.1 hypothetical protein P170DRAFT_469473 [Aspergillus steynii IBT 23096]
MTRWGPRLFECDNDIEIARNLIPSLGFNITKWPHTLDQLVTQREPSEYLENTVIPSLRTKLNACDFGARLFDACRARETTPKTKYRTIILGALLMRAGARIKPGDLEYLRIISNFVVCHSRDIEPGGEEGFVAPGRAQFLAAVDKYRDGVPRGYREQSCYQCGLTANDVGRQLIGCAKCGQDWYCSEDCQNLHRQDHQLVCAWALSGLPFSENVA